MRTQVTLTVDQALDLAQQRHRAGELAEAESMYRQVLAVAPDCAAAHCNLAATLQDMGRLEEAVSCYERALAIAPDVAEIHCNLGTALHDLGRPDEAEVSYRRALALNPDYAEAFSNLGNTLTRQLRLEEAIACYEQALMLKPDYAEAHFNLSVPLLLQGQFARGWQEHEWRWRCSGFLERDRQLVAPLWDGGPLEGRTILLHAEQGFGDAIQFVRYVPLVAAHGRRIILEVQPHLQRLLQRLPHADQVIARGAPLPPCDVHAPLMSLPFLLGTRLDTIPAQVPYLRAEDHLAALWRQRLARECVDGKFKVGLVWGGSPIHKNDDSRSLPLAALARLGMVLGVRLFSLQKGPAADQLQSPPPGLHIVDLRASLHDFADTAAAIAALDLVITVDTAVAHLAGALGRPVWLLLADVADWRWLLHRDDSPWYPTMRLFRQIRTGDWSTAVTEVVDALAFAVTATRSIGVAITRHHEAL